MSVSLHERDDGDSQSFDSIGFIGFCRSRAFFVVAVYVVAFLFFGMWALHDMVTFDAEGLYESSNADKWYMMWISIDRWSLVALKSVLGVLVVNPYFSVALFLALFPLSAILWCYGLHVWSKGKLGTAALLAFSMLYLSSPIWAQQFAYRNQLEVMSVALALAPVAVLMLSAFLVRRRVAWGIGAVVLLAFLFGCYQSFIFLCASGTCAFFLARGAATDFDVHSGASSSRIRGGLFVAVAMFVIAFLIHLAASSLCMHLFGDGQQTDYLSAQFSWLSNDFVTNVKTILRNLAIVFLGNGGEYGPLFGVEALVILVLIVMLWLRKTASRGAYVVVAIATLLIPNLLMIVTAHEVVVRSQFSLAFTIAFLGAFELALIETALRRPSIPAGCRSAVVVFLLLVAFLPQAQMQTRLLYTDVQTMDRDLRNFEQIYYRAMELGANPGDAPCLIGRLDLQASESMARSEVIGYSYFEYTGYYAPQKAIEAMDAYGFDVSFPTGAQLEQAEEEAKSMEAWPRAGSISVHDGYYVVNLGPTFYIR